MFRWLNKVMLNDVLLIKSTTAMCAFMLWLAR